MEVSKVLGGFLSDAKILAILMGLVESWRTRNNHTFIRKFYGTFFDYPCAYGNLAKILGNINQ